MIQPMRIRDFMTTDLHTVSPETEIMSAVSLLVDLDVSGLLVTDAGGALVGILTERDCIDVALHSGYFDEAGGLVQNFMTADVDTIDPDVSMMDLAETFTRTPFRRFPVVEDGKLVGLISRRDVLRALSSGAWFASPASPVEHPTP
jgi:CBS domain-containing protein